MEHPIPYKTCDIPTPRPYAERGLAELGYIRAILIQKDEAVPFDLDAAIIEKGGILD